MCLFLSINTYNEYYHLKPTRKLLIQFKFTNDLNICTHMAMPTKMNERTRRRKTLNLHTTHWTECAHMLWYLISFTIPLSRLSLFSSLSLSPPSYIRYIVHMNNIVSSKQLIGDWILTLYARICCPCDNQQKCFLKIEYFSILINWLYTYA